jgi:hypothetical protein
MAMNGWADGEPAWWLNLQANPNATVVLADGPRSVKAHAAAGAERSRLWAKWREVEPELDGYAARRPSETALVILEPRQWVELTAWLTGRWSMWAVSGDRMRFRNFLDAFIGWTALAGYSKITVVRGRATLYEVSLAAVLKLLRYWRIKGQMGGPWHEDFRGNSCILDDSHAALVGR